MKKLDPVVVKETKYILYFTLIFSVLMQAVFLIIGHWDETVIFGNILGIVASVGNFLLMGITVQKALVKEEKDATNLVKLSQYLRLLMLFGIAMIGYFLPFINTAAVVIPYLFPRIAIMIRSLTLKGKGE